MVSEMVKRLEAEEERLLLLQEMSEALDQALLARIGVRMLITQFCEREKHCLVNIKHVEKVTLNDGTTLNYNLGQQVSEVRNTHQHVKGDTERKKWLTELGFVWILRGSAHDFYEMKGGGEEQGSAKPALKI